MIVPYLAGGATDVGARVVAEKMARGLGQAMVIDNRPGAGVIVGTNAVAKSDPDGYTVLITTLAHPINITLQKKLPYDSIADFEPVALMGIINFILVVHPSLPVTDLASLIAYLKANPDKANYGSAGTGSPMHLGPELFKSLTGVEANHVPYRGESAALNDMVGGRLTFMLSGTPTVAPHIQAGSVRALAIPSPKRSAMLPDVPTTAEAGLPKWQTYSCIMMLAPKGTPRADRRAAQSRGQRRDGERRGEGEARQARHRRGGKLYARKHREVHSRRGGEMGADREGDRRAGRVGLRATSFPAPPPARPRPSARARS